MNELAEEGTATTKTNTLRALQTLKSHYDKTWSATTLDKLILIGRDALQQRNELKRRTGTNPTLDSGDLSIFFLLSDALRDRYLRLGGIHDVEEQISLFESLAQDIDFSGEGMLLQSNFGAALRDKYTCYGQSEDINRAAELHSSLLDHSPEGAVFKPRILYDLARSLHVRCQQLKGSEDFMRCVSLANEALQALPRSSPWYSRTQLSLVLSLSSRAQRGGDVSDIEKACQIAEAVVRNTSPDYPERHHAHHHLAYAHHSLYVRSSSAIHLNYCIEHWQRAIEAQDTSSRTRALHVCFLASSLRMKWASSGQLADLMNCIKILQDLNFEDVPTMNRDAYYTVLGVSLLDRADTLGSAEDLDRGVYLLRKRVAHNASPNMARTYALQSLGSALRRRYDWEKNIDDLHEAIEAGRQSLDLCTSLGISTNYITLFMLVGALSKLHQDTDSIFELYQASGLCKQWLSARNRLPVGYIQHQYLQRCGEVSLQLYSLESGLDDLNAAVSHFEEALALITAEDARADVLLDISTAKLRRFAYLGREEDEDEAMRHLEEALSLLPVGYAHRATVLFKLAEVHFANDTKHRSLPDGLARLNEALGDDYQNPQMRLTSALRLLAVVETQFRSERYFHQWRSSLLAAYIRAIKLLPRVAYFGLDADSRLQVLSSSDKLAADGAAHALLLGQPDVATEILEQGRAVFWQQYFQLRTSFHDLPKELASRLTQIATILDHRTQFHKQVASATEEVDSVEQQENEAAERRKLSREFDELLQEARSVEGFESFLLPDAFQIISIAASRGPIVVLVASELTCQAILIKSPNEVTRRDLPSLDVSKLNSLAKSFAQGTQAGRSKLRNRAIKGRMMRTHASVETVLKTLWRDCIQLVADALGLEVCILLSKMPFDVLTNVSSSSPQISALRDETNLDWFYVLLVLLPSSPSMRQALISHHTLALVPNASRITVLYHTHQPLAPCSTASKLRERQK